MSPIRSLEMAIGRRRRRRRRSKAIERGKRRRKRPLYAVGGEERGRGRNLQQLDWETEEIHPPRFPPPPFHGLVQDCADKFPSLLFPSLPVEALIWSSSSRSSFSLHRNKDTNVLQFRFPEPSVLCLSLFVSLPVFSFSPVRNWVSENKPKRCECVPRFLASIEM